MTEKYLNSALSAEERAKDLLSKMSLAEKLGQVQCFGRAQMGKRKADDLFPHGFGQVSNLIAVAMPTEQAVAKMVNEDQRLAMRLSDHHIPALFHIESLSGPLVANSTTFPSGIGQASTWDPVLEEEVGKVIGKQSRAVGMRQVCAPVLDVTHDPRFGRDGRRVANC